LDRQDLTDAACRRGRRALQAGRYARALEIFESLVRERPDWAAARYHLARASFALGHIESATRLLRSSLRLRSSFRARRFLATIAPLDPRLDHAAILQHRMAFGDAIRVRAGDKAPDVLRRRRTRSRSSPRRALKIGYFSSFFCEDNWMKAVWGLIDHHDTRRFEVHLFSDECPVAAVRRRARRSGARVHDISELDNEAAARRIARTGVDVPVDLNQYSRVGRLPMFAARLAPVVVAWFNIFATSGMPAFDALIGDRWLVRDGEKRWYVESIVELPQTSLAFSFSYPVPRVAPLPWRKTGSITFGSLGSLYKINDGVVGAWCEILRRTPGSRLVLGNAFLEDSGNREHTLGRFRKRRIAADRVILRGVAEHFDFLRYYDSIDIALDTFPYNGGTTTAEAIWQGVPVIAVSGDRWISRTSGCLLANAGLDDFLCDDLEGYIDTAVRWASPNRAKRLGELRQTMRSRLRASPVTDCSGLARSMEDVYRRLAERPETPGRRREAT